MNISNQTKVLLLIAAILIFILIFSNYFDQNPIQNEGSLIMENDMNNIQFQSNNDEYQYLDDNQYNEIPRNDLVITDDDESLIYNNNCASGNCTEEKYRKRLRSKNRAKNGQYKKSSYSGGTRGNGPSEFDNFFEKNNEMVKDVYTNNEDFSPNDETGGTLAAYKPGKKVKMTEEEMFNADNLLPKETNKDWFEVAPEPISVKNRHLINISRPIGINTIGTSNKIPNYDIRGTIPNPKFVVSPFLNSSVEPDINNRGLGC